LLSSENSNLLTNGIVKRDTQDMGELGRKKVLVLGQNLCLSIMRQIWMVSLLG